MWTQLDLNPRPLGSKATTQPGVPQPQHGGTAQLELALMCGKLYFKLYPQLSVSASQYGSISTCMR